MKKKNLRTMESLNENKTFKVPLLRLSSGKSIKKFSMSFYDYETLKQ